MMRSTIPSAPGGTVGGPTAAQQRYPLRHITIFDLDPAAKDRSQRMPTGETLLGRDRNQLVCPLIQGYLVSDERKAAWRSTPGSQPKTADEPASEPQRLLRCSCQCLVRKAETEKDNSQKRV